MDIPKIKKKISSFLTKEDGKISKDKLMKTGILVAAISLAMKQVGAAETHDVHDYNIVRNEDGSVTASHAHHVSY